MGYIENYKMNDSDPRVSIIIPCHNEQENIESCVDEIEGALGDAGISYELLVVNDGSTDDTLRRARSLSLQRSFIRVIDLRENYGKTIALREGVRRARGEIIAFFDADLQYSPKDLVAMIARLRDGVDVVNGSRDYNGYGGFRTAFSRLYNRALRFLFQMETKDSNCGVKVLRRNILDTDTTFSYGLPLVVPLLKIRGFESIEVPVTLHERRSGESKYFQEGQFLGGSRNIRDITYHSLMLLSLLAHAPFKSRRRNESFETGVPS